MRIRVLLADDHAIVRDGIRAILSEYADIEVVGDAQDGIEMLREVRRLDPDVVVVDIAMPQMSGINAIRRMKEAGATARPIVLSMYSTVEHVLDALRAGAQGYLIKHSVGAELVQAIRLVAGGHRFLSKEVSEAIVHHHLSALTSADTPRRSRSERLSPREREILQLTIEGKAGGEIAALLRLSPSSVYTYRSRMMRKLGVGSVAELVRLAIQRGLTPLE